MWNPSLAIGARNSMCLPQRKFAKVIGVHPTTIAKWESGKKEPSEMAKTLLRAILVKPNLFKPVTYDPRGLPSNLMDSEPISL